MRLFRPFREVGYHFVDTLRDIKPIKSVACLIEDVESQIIGGSSDDLMLLLLALALKSLMKDSRITREVGISLILAHRFLPFFAQYSTSRKEVSA